MTGLGVEVVTTYFAYLRHAQFFVIFYCYVTATHVLCFYYVFGKCTVNDWCCSCTKETLLLPYTSVLHVYYVEWVMPWIRQSVTGHVTECKYFSRTPSLSFHQCAVFLYVIGTI